VIFQLSKRYACDSTIERRKESIVQRALGNCFFELSGYSRPKSNHEFAPKQQVGPRKNRTCLRTTRTGGWRQIPRSHSIESITGMSIGLNAFSYRAYSKMSEDVKTTRILEAVKDPVRMQILFFLLKNGRTNVGDIAGQFEITRPAISHHLKVLKDAEVVNSEKQGQEIFYSPNGRLISEALRALADKIDRVYTKGHKRR
jgi:ArsR family transcriptional regulator